MSDRDRGSSRAGTPPAPGFIDRSLRVLQTSAHVVLLTAVAAVSIGSLLLLAGYTIPVVKLSPERVSTTLAVIVGTAATTSLAVVAVRSAISPGTPETPPEPHRTRKTTAAALVDSSSGYHPEYQLTGARCLDDGSIEVYVEDSYLIIPSVSAAKYVAERINSAAGLSTMLHSSSQGKRLFRKG